MHLPFLTARFELRPPHVAVPHPGAPHLGRPNVSPEHPGRQRVQVGPLTLPSPEKTFYYVGLGALAAIEIVEWPIAAAIAAGTYVAQHTRSDQAALPHVEFGHGEMGERERAEAQTKQGTQD